MTLAERVIRERRPKRDTGTVMSDRAAKFVGNIPTFYDQGLGPVFFAEFADDIARRVAASAPIRVLETAAGTGIVTRRLRDLLPREAQLTATDLNPPMLEAARGKFRAEERVTFQPADATALPFPDDSFDAVVCQFGVMFFPDKDKAYHEARLIPLSQGPTIGSVPRSQIWSMIGGCGGTADVEAPKVAYRVPEDLPRRDDLRRVPVPPTLARGVRLPGLRRRPGRAAQELSTGTEVSLIVGA
jgi:SAM-dependent methyltransferase